MNQLHRFRRRKPDGGVDSDETPATPDDAQAAPVPLESSNPADSAADLLRIHLNASLSSAVAGEVSAGNDATAAETDGINPAWRGRLAEIGEAAGLSDDQQAAIERLAKAQLDEIRREIPRLLDELKPHFDTPHEAEAKRRHEAGLWALKARLDQETNELLHSLGLTPGPG